MLSTHLPVTRPSAISRFLFRSSFCFLAAALVFLGGVSLVVAVSVPACVPPPPANSPRFLLHSPRPRPALIHQLAHAAMAHARAPLTGDQLTGLHKILALSCGQKIALFTAVKSKTNGDPEKSVAEGEELTACYQDVCVVVGGATKRVRLLACARVQRDRVTGLVRVRLSVALRVDPALFSRRKLRPHASIRHDDVVSRHRGGFVRFATPCPTTAFFSQARQS